MKIYFECFLLFLFCSLLAGCKTEGNPKKELTTIRVYLETTEATGARSRAVSILRDQPMMVQINPNSFLDERYLEQASLVDWKDSFYIKIKFDWHGSLMLDNVTSSNPGKRLAVEANFGQHRWLAAPVVNHRISDGTLTFTPDATHEEAERIVRGVNNLARKLKDHKKFYSPPSKFD